MHKSLIYFVSGLLGFGTALAREGAIPAGGVGSDGASTHLAWRLERLVSEPGEEEAFAPLAEADGSVELSWETEALDTGAHELRFRARNRTGERLFLRMTAELPVPFPVADWWNGYQDQQGVQFDPDDVSLSVWFPANAALGAEQGLALGVHPRRVYSRVETGRRVDGDPALSLALPFVLDAEGELSAFEGSFVVARTGVRYGYRDVVQRYYDLFPEAYQPAPGIHPGVLSTQFYWLRNPRRYGEGIHIEDLARRFTGGRGAWEWWYAPFVRGGDWATTVEWTEGWRNYTRERIERHRERINARLDEVLAEDVAPMYYVNILDGERSLVEEHFPEAIEVEEPRYRTPWRQETVSRVYPFGNAYGDLFASGLRRIAEDYPSARGIGWDSCFGHQTVTARTAGVEQTPGRSFRRGEIFALQGAAYAHLLDLNHSLFNGEHRMANAVNLKLVSPYYLGARSDSALYEGAPMERPERLLRLESLRARLGSRKALTWHKYSLPEKMRWIPWDDMDADEIRAAFRQVQDDTLFLCYYWGSLPVPGTPAVGMERLFLSVPLLIDLVQQGWQPAPAVDTPPGVLAARFGRGLGARIALINPDFREVEARIFAPRAYWPAGYPLFTREDGQDLEYEMAPDGVALLLRLPPREVVLLRAAGLVSGEVPDDVPVRVRSQHRTLRGGRRVWVFNVITRVPFAAEAEFFAAPGAGRAELRVEGAEPLQAPGGAPIRTRFDAARWPRDEQASYYYMGDIHLRQDPQVRIAADAQALRPWAALDGGRVPALVLPDPDDAELRREAQRVAHWFGFYTHRRFENAVTPAVSGIPPDEGAYLDLRVSGEGLDDHEAGAIVPADGRGIRVQGRDMAALRETVQEFLRQMDAAYPYVGVIVENDRHLERAGLSGAVLTHEPQAAPVVEPTLLDFMRRQGLVR